MAISSKIVVHISDLLSQGKSIDSLINDLVSLNKRLDTLKTNIADSWEGDAGKTYVAKVDALSQQATELVEVLKEFKGYATKAAEEFNSADKEGASAIRGCF